MFSQVLLGDTLMGEHIVDNDFSSAYIGAAYNLKQLGWEDLTLAMRGDWYQVVDNDDVMYDPNGSRGNAFTVSVRYDITSYLSVSTEWQLNSGHQENLRFFQSDENYREQLFQLAFMVTL